LIEQFAGATAKMTRIECHGKVRSTT
jgi:hypothetical protein